MLIVGGESMFIRSVEIGSGMPKICVPITGGTKEEIIEEAKRINTVEIDLIEWRVDFFEDILEMDRVLTVLRELQDILDKPLIFTIRRKQEGGEKEIAIEDYLRINSNVIEERLADVVDIELFIGDSYVEELVEIAQINRVCTIISNHDFEKTPHKEVLVERLYKMNDLGGDIAKIAVMPNSVTDVITLLDVTNEMSGKLAIPIVTMSMSLVGLISRLIGQSVGSAITFGSVGKISAPGQIPSEELRKILEIINKYS